MFSGCCLIPFPFSPTAGTEWTSRILTRSRMRAHAVKRTRLQLAFVQPLLVLAAGGCLAVLGCNLSRPQLANPGHRYSQQLRATYYDPYADPDAAPDIDGGRPRDYLVPRAEPVQSQWFFGKR